LPFAPAVAVVLAWSAALLVALFFETSVWLS
jgi:hypothetical protein